MGLETKQSPAGKEVKKEKWSIDKKLSDFATMLIVPLDNIQYLLKLRKKKSTKG